MEQRDGNCQKMTQIVDKCRQLSSCLSQIVVTFFLNAVPFPPSPFGFRRLRTQIPKIRSTVLFLSKNFVLPKAKLPKCGIYAFWQGLDFCSSFWDTWASREGNSDFLSFMSFVATSCWGLLWRHMSSRDTSERPLHPSSNYPEGRN